MSNYTSIGVIIHYWGDYKMQEFNNESVYIWSYR